MTRAPDIVFTTPELADHLQCSGSSLRNWISRGKGPRSFRIGFNRGHHRFRFEDLDAWLVETDMYMSEGECAFYLDIKETTLRRKRKRGEEVPVHTFDSKGCAWYQAVDVDEHAVGLSIHEVSEILHVGTGTLARWRRDGVGPTFRQSKISRRAFYDKASVEACLEWWSE